MHSNDRQNTIDFTVNRNNLYREESFTDVRVPRSGDLLLSNPTDRKMIAGTPFLWGSHS